MKKYEEERKEKSLSERSIFEWEIIWVGGVYSLNKIGKYNTEIENRVKKVSNL